MCKLVPCIDIEELLLNNFKICNILKNKYKWFFYSNSKEYRDLHLKNKITVGTPLSNKWFLENAF